MKIPSYLTKPIAVVYEDNEFIVFNKPANLLVIPTPEKEENTLIHIVNYQYAQKKGSRELKESEKLHPCHRLDRDTSGVIIFSKGLSNQHRMMHLFKKRQVKKEYMAIIHGRLKRPKGQLISEIKDLKKRGRNAPVASSQKAILNYEALEEFKDCSLVKIRPITGRTNQIRIQFSEIGHPLVGDRKFSLGRDYEVKFRRTALHAHGIEFVHPVTRKTVSIKTVLPEDMEVFLARHRN